MELILETKTFPEPLRKLIQTDRVRVTESDGVIYLTPIPPTDDEPTECLQDSSDEA